MLATQTELTIEQATKVIEKSKYFEISGTWNEAVGVIPETKVKKKVRASRTEIDSVIFSPPILGKWKTTITNPVIAIVGAMTYVV